MLNNVTVFNIPKSNNDLGEDELQYLLSEFSCRKNPDVERFLKEQSIEFTKKNQSVTYFVFSDEDASLLGYFTIAIKPITVKAENFSNTMKRKIARVSELNPDNGTYTLSAYLIAQLGKNFTDEINKNITGEQLLQTAVDTIKELQYMVGGMVIFLEAENEEKLLEFYEKSGFKIFDTRKMKSRENSDLIQLSNIKQKTAVNFSCPWMNAVSI